MSAAGRHLKRVFRFASGLALDLLVPDVVEKVVKACQHFHRCFLVLDINERVEIYRELESVSTAQESELAGHLVTEWAKQMPPGVRLPAEAKAVAEQVVRGLRAADAAASAEKDPGEALRRSINQNLPGRRQIESPVLDPAQRSLGRLMMASRMASAERRPSPVPADATTPPGYSFLRVLGSGGFGTVYLARHEPSGTLRAVKVGPLTEPGRFRREVELAARLNSPHLVRYFDSGEIGDRFWISMEHLGDTTLADLMARADFRARPDLLPELASQLLAGLEHLHAAGMVHRDLKPANVMVGDDFRLKIIDFGLAKPVDAMSAQGHTQTGTLIGSPTYMSPEQLRGRRDISPASDVYSAGAVIYEMFVGRPPHVADNFADIVLKAFTEEVDFSPPSLPAAARPFLQRCLDREAHARFADGESALANFGHVAADVSRRLRHERYRPAWQPVLDRGLIEQYVAKLRGRPSASAVEGFQRALRKVGLAECDGVRLAEALPEIIAADARAAESDEDGEDVTAVVRSLLGDTVLDYDRAVTAREVARRQRDAPPALKVKAVPAEKTSSRRAARKAEDERGEVRRAVLLVCLLAVFAVAMFLIVRYPVARWTFFGLTLVAFFVGVYTHKKK